MLRRWEHHTGPMREWRPLDARGTVLAATAAGGACYILKELARGEPVAVLEEAATCLDPDGRAWLLGFLNRTEANRSIDVMGFELVTGSDGPTFRQVPWDERRRRRAHRSG